MMLSRIWQWWREFWFEPRSPITLSVYRIAFGILVLQSALIHTWPGFLTWYGVNSVISFNSVKQYAWAGQPRFDILQLLPHSDAWVIVFFWFYVAFAFCLTIGFCTRYSAALVALGLISMQHHFPCNYNAGDTLMRLSAIFLSFSPAGDALSLDVLIKKGKGEPMAQLVVPWAQRMLQIQIVILYFQTFWVKIMAQDWLNGTAVYYAVRVDYLMRFPIPFIFDNLLICKLLAWYTLFVEFAMWSLIWFKPCRYYVLTAAVFLHLGIDWSLNIPVFEWLMLASFINFIEPSDLKSWGKALKLCLIRWRALIWGKRIDG